MKRVRRALRSRRGFSLTEMLAATVILTLLTSMGAMGVTSALKNRASTIRIADAETLASTAAAALADELRFGQNILVENDQVTLDSATYGQETTIQAENGILTAGGRQFPGFGEEAYAGLKLAVKFEAIDAAVQVTLTVTDGDSPIYEPGPFTVYPLNGLSVDGGGGGSAG